MNEPSENSNLKRKFENFTHPVEDANWDAISAHLNTGSRTGILGDKFAGHTVQPGSHVWRNVAAAIGPGGKRRPAAWWWAAAAAAAAILLFSYAEFEYFNSAVERKPIAAEKPRSEPHTDGADAEKGTAADEKKNSDEPLSDEAAAAPPATDIAEVVRNAADAGPGEKQETKSESATRVKSLAGNSLSEKSEDAQPIAASEPLLPAESEKLNEGRGSSESATGETMNLFRSDGLAGLPDFAEGNAYAVKTAETPMEKMTLRQPVFPHHAAQPDFEERIAAPVTTDVGKSKEGGKSSVFFDGTETSPSRDVSLWAGSQIALATTDAESSDMSIAEFQSSPGLAPNMASATTRDYSPPVYYGLNGELNVRKRLSAGLGFGYLRMQSTSTLITGSGDRAIRHIADSYLSVPVYLKYSFIDRPKFAAYSTLGHSFDISVAQRISDEAVQNSQIALSFGDPEIERGNQANVYTGLGVNFKFTKRLGVFAEGSLMHYYFMSNDNFFSEQKLWPGLRFGVLFSFE